MVFSDAVSVKRRIYRRLKRKLRSDQCTFVFCYPCCDQPLSLPHTCFHLHNLVHAFRLFAWTQPIWKATTAEYTITSLIIRRLDVEKSFESSGALANYRDRHTATLHQSQNSCSKRFTHERNLEKNVPSPILHSFQTLVKNGLHAKTSRMRQKGFGKQERLRIKTSISKI